MTIREANRGSAPSVASAADPQRERNPGPNPYLDVLLASYEAERLADSNGPAALIGLLTATIGLSGLVGALLINHGAPTWLIALAPTAHIPFMAFGALMAHVSQVRGELIYRYEREIRRCISPPSPWLLVPPVGGALMRRVWRGWFGSSVVVLLLISILAGYIAILVESYRLSHDMHPVLALSALSFCSCATLVILVLYAFALFPERVVDSEVERLAQSA